MADALNCAADLTKLQSVDFIQALVERRKVWLQAANLPESLQMNRLPATTFASGDTKPLDLLGTEEAAARLKEYEYFINTWLAASATKGGAQMA